MSKKKRRQRNAIIRAELERRCSLSSAPVSKPAGKESFYHPVLDVEERRLLEQARNVDGLDEEMALLRVKLASILARDPGNTELLLKVIALLIRAIAARARYMPDAGKEYCNNIISNLMDLSHKLSPGVSKAPRDETIEG